MLFIGQVSKFVRNFNIVMYSSTINVINVKLCMMVLPIELYLFTPISLTLVIFQIHRNVELFTQKILCSYPITLKLCRIAQQVN